VAVPSLAANTEISFSSDIAFVNEADETLTVTLTRAGTFGSLTVDWISGYAAANRPAGVENGEITPALGTVGMAHGQEEMTLTVQVRIGR
ncbi:G-protein coupled receptor 98, partial [Plakobranchus ocellatus]